METEGLRVDFLDAVLAAALFVAAFSVGFFGDDFLVETFFVAMVCSFAALPFCFDAVRATKGWCSAAMLEVQFSGGQHGRRNSLYYGAAEWSAAGRGPHHFEGR